MSSHAPSKEERLVKALRDLEKEVHALPEHYSYLFNPMKNVWLMFLKGIAYGLGILVAVAIVVPLTIAMLRSIEWVPLIGDFLTDITQSMEEHTSAIPRR